MAPPDVAVLTLACPRDRDTIGARGLATALSWALGAHAPEAADELFVLSGVAFRAYMFLPDDNHGFRHELPGVEWAWGSLDIENYGLTESLSAHFGRDLRTYDKLRPDETAALVARHLTERRPLVGALPGEPRVWGVVVGCRALGRDLSLGLDVPGWDSTTLAVGDAPDGIDRSLPLVVMPESAIAPPPSRLDALRADVLQFAVAHGRSKRELNFAEELYYASGRRAFLAAAQLASIPAVVQSAGWSDFFAAWNLDLRQARAAASRTFQRWADSGRAEWGAVAQAYAATVALVPEATARFDWTDGLGVDSLRASLLAAEASEAVALEALEAATARLAAQR